MKIGVVRNDEIMIFRGERCAGGFQHMAADFAHIELAGEDIVAVVLPKLIGLVAPQSAGSGRSLMDKHGHELRRSPLVLGLVNGVVILAIDPAINRVYQSITEAC